MKIECFSSGQVCAGQTNTHLNFLSSSPSQILDVMVSLVILHNPFSGHSLPLSVCVSNPVLTTRDSCAGQDNVSLLSRVSIIQSYFLFQATNTPQTCARSFPSCTASPRAGTNSMQVMKRQKFLSSDGSMMMTKILNANEREKLDLGSGFGACWDRTQELGTWN